MIPDLTFPPRVGEGEDGGGIEGVLAFAPGEAHGPGVAQDVL
jgi:hypothetical protein